MEKTDPDMPVRSYMDDPAIQWRSSKPDYSGVNRKYLLERTRFHPKDSLEKLVENLVKTWEMEATHKINPKDWKTVDVEKYRVSVNGGFRKDIRYNIQYGNYIMTMDSAPLYDVTRETHATSHGRFIKAFPEGFAWELLDLYSGPPRVSFSWRHWAHWIGPYIDQEPTGELIELFGVCVVDVDDQLKITDLQVYYDPNPMLAKMMGLSSGRCPAMVASRL